MRLEARAATADDLEVAASLVDAAAAEAGNERGGALLVALARPEGSRPDRLVEQMRDENSLVALGLIDDVTVGVAMARLADPYSGGRLATIDALYVEPGARSVGLGEELLEFVSHWARSRGATGLDVRVLPGVREAKNFFESAGYVARCIVMHRPLGPGVG